MVESGTLGKEWQMVTGSSKERLQYLYTSSEYSDLDIVFPEHEVTFKTHRLVLAMSSSVFGAMLVGPLAVGKELTLPHDSPRAFRKLLDHMYLDQMDLQSVDEALEAYALAHKYRMESARKVCVQHILSNLKEETTLAALETSITYEDEVLNKKSKEMLNRNPDAVMLGETVSCLSKENLRDLLKDDNMEFSSEVVPFKGLIAWGKAQFGHEEEEPSGSALREKIDDLLKEVRFLAMSCDEFVDNVVDTNVLSHTECIHILRAIRGADLSTVPEATPLNPVRTRTRRLRRMEDLSHYKFQAGGYPRNYSSSSVICLIENLSSSKNISIHYMKAPCGGTITIVDDEGKARGSATSDDGLFTFTRPVILKKDKQYVIVFSCTSSITLCDGPAGRETVGTVTLSYSGAHNCEIYVCEVDDISRDETQEFLKETKCTRGDQKTCYVPVITYDDYDYDDSD